MEVTMSEEYQPGEGAMARGGGSGVQVPPTAPSVISIADIETSRPSFLERLGGIGAGVGGMVQGRGRLIGLAALGLVVVLALFLLVLRPLLGGGGYTTLTADNPTAEHPDGIKVSLAGEEGKLRLKLGSIPRADFSADRLPKELQPAVESLPSHLSPKSPYYILDVKRNGRGPVRIEVVIPNAAEPWETLDLYSWDGTAWRWLPTQLDRGREVLVSEVASVPPSVMVMQSGMVQQVIASEVEAVPPAEAASVLTEADVVGMLIGTMGGLTGDATRLPTAAQGGGISLAPVVRNWIPGRDPNWALVGDMLTLEEDRAAHVQNLVGLAQSGGYPGVVLDYRNVRPEHREAYAAFVHDLAQAMHEQGLWLAVTVDTPSPMADGSWDTGGYDWAALGEAADQVRVVMPLDPQAYLPGGLVERMMEWATARVHRYKLYPIFDTLSTDGARPMTLEEALSAVGGVQVAQPVTDSISPGMPLAFTLGGNARLEVDATTGASCLATGEGGGCVAWLGTPQWLYSRLNLAARYHLGGVVLRNLFAEGNFPNLLQAVSGYLAQASDVAYATPEVVWEVSGPDGQVSQARTSLMQPQFAWTAPETPGKYQITASIAGVPRGGVTVNVTAPQAEAEEAPAEEETAAEDSEGAGVGGGEAEGGGSGVVAATTSPDAGTAEAETPLQAAFVTDVTVPDYSQKEKGEQFTKTWRLKNSGDRAWPEETVLVFSGGDKMGAPDQVKVGAVEPGATVDISVDMVAPDQDGTYKGVWRLQVNGENIEGGGVVVIIKVGEEQAGAPTSAGSPPAPVVPPSSGGGFELGGHVRDLGLPYADKMHYAGMTWAKTQVHFGQDAGGIIAVAHAKGFKIQLSALGSPAMVTEPGFEQKFANWVASLAAAGADAIEVWNEPNIDREWQAGYISPQAYTNLLCTAYNAIKSANAGTAVISAAPAPTGYFGGCSPNGCDDQPWMEGLYAAGAANCMDYIGAHHNAGATSPSARSGHPTGSNHHSWYFLPQTELYYNIFRGTRKLFYTEMGYASQEGVPPFSDQFAWARGINNAQQAAWLAEAAQLGSSTGMVRCIIIWNIDFVRYGYDPQDGYAIIRPDGSCPACDALHNVMGTR